MRARAVGCTLLQPRRAVIVRREEVVPWRFTGALLLYLVRATLRDLPRQCAEHHVAFGDFPRGEDFAATGVLRVAAPVMGSRGGIKMGCLPLYEASRWLLGASLISG